MVTKNKKLTANIFFLVLVQFSNYLAPLLVLPYLTRTLSIEQFGVVIMALSISAISFIFTDFGFVLSAPYWISKNRERKKEVSLHIGSIFYIKFFIIVLISLVIIFYFHYGNGSLNNYQSILFFILANVFFQAFQPTWFFQGIEKMKFVTFTVVTSKLTYLILVFLLVHKQGQQNMVIFCLAFSNLLAALVGVTLIYKEGYKISYGGFTLVKEVFLFSLNFFISRAAVGIYTSASTFIIGSFAGLHQAALYSSAEKLYQAGQSLTSPVTQALLPHLSKTKDIATLYKFILFITPVLIIGCSVCIYFSKGIVILFYGSDFASASQILDYFLICSVITFVSINLGYPAFSIIDRLDLVNKTVYIASFLYVLLLMALIYFKAVNSLNIVKSVLLIEMIVLFLRVFFLFKSCKKYNL